MEPFDPSRVRRSDPETSCFLGAISVNFRAESAKGRLLRVFVQHDGSLTSAEAAERAGMFKPGNCYWKRVGELAQEGLLTATGTQYEERTGSSETTYRSTSKGERAFAGMR